MYPVYHQKEVLPGLRPSVKGALAIAEIFRIRDDPPALRAVACRRRKILRRISSP